MRLLERLVLGAALLALLILPSSGERCQAEEGRGFNACGLCEGTGGLPERALTPSVTDSIGRAIARHNERVIARTDSLYRAGRFGAPDTPEAQRRALVHFQLRSWNGFRYTADLASSQDRLVLVTGDTPLAPFAKGYANTAVYPLRFIDKVRAGRGGFCVDYRIPESYDEKILDGGVTIRVRRQTVDLDGKGSTPVLNREAPTSLHKTVELLYESRFCGQVREERVVDRGDTLMLLSIDHLEGSHVRKFGTHQLGAITEWRSYVEGDRDPVNPRIGACAYFPHIHLDMPFFLPDLGLDDLRDFDFPFPMMKATWFQSPPKDVPSWLGLEATGTITGWDSAGPRPTELNTRYPDL